MRKLACVAVVALLAFGATAAQGALQDGLRAYWDFDGNGDDTAGDYAGTANTVDDDLTAQNSAPIAVLGGLPGFDQYTDLDGSSHYWDTAASADTQLTGTLTISGWFKAAWSTGDGWQTLISHGDGAEYRIASYANPGIGGISDNPYYSGPDTIKGSTNILDGDWHHIAVTYDAVDDATIMYLDGAVEGSITASAFSYDSPLAIGENSQAGGRNWTGGIDDVAIWDRELTSTEVEGIYNAGVAGDDLGTVIPEPATLALLGLGGIGLLIRRKRR